MLSIILLRSSSRSSGTAVALFFLFWELKHSSFLGTRQHCAACSSEALAVGQDGPNGCAVHSHQPETQNQHEPFCPNRLDLELTFNVLNVSVGGGLPGGGGRMVIVLAMLPRPAFWGLLSAL